MAKVALAAWALALVAAAFPRVVRAEPRELRVTIAAAPVLGVDAEAEVRVAIADSAARGKLTDVRFACSVGRVEDAAVKDDGSVIGRFVLPSERYPQTAIVVATATIDGAPAVGAAFPRLRAAASPAFHTDPGARVTLVVGDKSFGPARAGADGSVRIPIVVPPGVGFAIARSENEFGVATEQPIDLGVPPYPRALLVAPEHTTAGAAFEVLAFAVEPSGAPAPPERIALRARGRRPTPLGGAAGQTRFLVQAPANADDGSFEVMVEAPGAPESGRRATRSIRLVAGPPAQLVLHPDRSRLAAGTDARLLLAVTAADALGNRTSAEEARLYVDGRPIDAAERDHGRAVFAVPAPPARPRAPYLALEVLAGRAYVRHELPLTGVPGVAAAAEEPEWEPRHAVTARAGAAFGDNDAVGPSLFVDAFGRLPSWPAALATGVTLGVLHTDAAPPDATGFSRVQITQAPLLATARWRLRPHRRVEAAFGVGAGASWARVQVHTFGHALTSQAAALALEGTTELGIALGRAQLVAGARYLWVQLGQLASGDRIEGNSAGLVLDAGCRWRW